MSNFKESDSNLFLKFLDPNRSILRFILGTAFLTLALNSLQVIALDFSGDATAPQLWGSIILTVVAGGLVAVVFIYDITRLRQQVGQIQVTEEERLLPRKGLILLISPHPGTAPASIEHHLGSLAHCWLIATSGSLPTALELKSKYESKGVEFYLGQPNYVVDPDRLQSTYDVVTRIFDEEAPAAGLLSSDVIADITGGFKPLTAGMTLACLARDRDMVYMKKPRDSKGDPIDDAPFAPVLIDTKFIPSK